jgi:hypothetical protein
VPTAATQRYYVCQDETSDDRGIVHQHWVEAWDDDGHPMIVCPTGLIRVDQVAAFAGRAWSIRLADEPERGTLRSMFADPKPTKVVWH